MDLYAKKVDATHYYPRWNLFHREKHSTGSSSTLVGTIFYHVSPDNEPSYAVTIYDVLGPDFGIYVSYNAPSFDDACKMARHYIETRPPLTKEKVEEEMRKLEDD